MIINVLCTFNGTDFYLMSLLVVGFHVVVLTLLISASLVANFTRERSI